MKKQVLILVTAGAFALGTAFFTSCCSSKCDKETDKTEQEQVEEEVAYICPMKCEGDKTYTEAGACPVCGMDLVEK